MKNLLRLITLGLLLSTQPLLADTLEMRPDTQKDPVPRVNPPRGLTMPQVEARYGEPTAKRPPVGNPPISRWLYDDTVVYFEHNRVLHSVDRH